MFPRPGADPGKGALVHGDAVVGIILHRGALDDCPTATANGNTVTRTILDGDVSKRDPASLNGDQRLVAAGVERAVDNRRTATIDGNVVGLDGDPLVAGPGDIDGVALVRPIHGNLKRFGIAIDVCRSGVGLGHGRNA